MYQNPQGPGPQGPQSAPQGPNIHNFVTIAFDFSGYRVVRNFGVVRGIIVRSRSVVGNIGAGFQQLFGGNISIYTELCEQARNDSWFGHFQVGCGNSVQSWSYSCGDKSKSAKRCFCNSDRGVTWR